MAQNTTVDIPARTWTQLTNADATYVSFSVQGPRIVSIKGAIGAVAPTDFTAAYEYEPGQGELNKLIAEMWPGTTYTRLYAYSSGNALVTISHA
jgi:hypothetical protein